MPNLTLRPRRTSPWSGTDAQPEQRGQAAQADRGEQSGPPGFGEDAFKHEDIHHDERDLRDAECLWTDMRLSWWMATSILVHGQESSW